MLNPFSLENKTILITGASSGIGRQCAISCVEAGAQVIILGRNEDRLTETANLLPDQHLKGKHIVHLEQEESVTSFIANLKDNGVQLSGVIHAAGISTTLPLKSSTLEKQLEFYATNVAGPVNLTRLLLKKGNGLVDNSSIVFISSVMSMVGEKAKSLYGGTKGAINAVVKSMALEYAARKIRINAISPGVVESPMSGKAVYSQSEQALAEVTQKHPLGIGKPEDVAYASIYLLSNAAKWITGSNLVVDGGYTAQ